MVNAVKICVVGSANVDLFFRMKRLPRPGETLAGHAWSKGFGGKGANQAVMAARLGARVSFIGCVGKDAFGSEILANLRAEGIDERFVETSSEYATGVASIWVEENGQNSIAIIPGANQSLSVEQVRRASASISSASCVLCQLETPLDATCEALSIARNAGVTAILNPAPAYTLPEDVLALVDLCIPNESELEILSNHTITKADEYETAARNLVDKGCRCVVVTLGSDGALIVDKSSSRRLSTHGVEAVDTSGAGDAFIGSLAYFLAGGKELPFAVQLANAVAGISVTRHGTQASFPNLAEVNAVLSQRREPPIA